VYVFQLRVLIVGPLATDWNYQGVVGASRLPCTLERNPDGTTTAVYKYTCCKQKIDIYVTLFICDSNDVAVAKVQFPTTIDK
jgi:hypothetical protein